MPGAVVSTTVNDHGAVSANPWIGFKPAGLAVGDCLVACLSAEGTAAYNMAIPTGWTRAFRSYDTTNNESSNADFVKIATQADVDAANFQFDMGGAPRGNIAMLRVTGVTGNVFGSATSAEGGETHPITLTPTGAPTLAIGHWGSKTTTSGSYEGPPEMTEHIDFTDSAPGVSLVVCSEYRTTTAQFTRTATSNWAWGHGGMYALEEGEPEVLTPVNVSGGAAATAVGGGTVESKTIVKDGGGIIGNAVGGALTIDWSRDGGATAGHRGGATKLVHTRKDGGALASASGGVYLRQVPDRPQWFPLPEEDAYYALLGFYSATAVLERDTTPLVPAVRAICGWHGTNFDPHRGLYAIVNTDGPLAEMVGERLRLSYFADPSVPRSVVIYVLDAGHPTDDISLSRRAFLALAPLWSSNIAVTAEVLA